MAIPVLYYHSIATHKKSKPWSFLSYPIELFERQIKYLYSKGYNTIFLYDLFEHMKNGKKLPKKTVILTFDDGFLDNWVFAYPIMKKYNMKATIYVNPDFVDKRQVIRSTLFDVWKGEKTIEQLDWWGYLSWDEMRIMEKSGFIDIQSHSLTHTWYFKSDQIVDFHHPNDKYYWLFWNEFPEKKPYWLKEYNDAIVDFGRPIYSYGKALTVKKYYEDKGLRDYLIDYVKKNGGLLFFNNPNWKTFLLNEVEKYRKLYRIKGHIESDKDYLKRIREELLSSKKIIEKELNKVVKFLCWPGGGQNELTFNIAYNIGYLSTTKGNRPNQYGEDPRKISRVSGVPPFSLPFLREKIDILFLFLQLQRAENKLLGKVFGKFMRFLYYLLKAQHEKA